MLYIIQYKPKRPHLIETMSQEEGKAIDAHFHYLTGLFTERTARLIGRREDGDFGIAILELPSLSEATSVMKNDPVVRAGVFQASVGEFKVVLGELV